MERVIIQEKLTEIIEDIGMVYNGSFIQQTNFYSDLKLLINEIKELKESEKIDFADIETLLLMDGPICKVLLYAASDSETSGSQIEEEYERLVSDAEEDLNALITALKEIEEEISLVIVFSTGEATCDLKGGILEIRRLKNAHYDLYIDLHHVGKIEFRRGYKKSDKIRVLIHNTVGAVIAEMVEYKSTNKIGIQKIGANCFSYEYMG